MHFFSRLALFDRLALRGVRQSVDDPKKMRYMLAGGRLVDEVDLRGCFPTWNCFLDTRY